MDARLLALTVGPVLFAWPKERIASFYARLAEEAPVERVVIGELVCSKRLPFYEDVLPEAIERLQRAGKRVAITSLALPTLTRERDAAKELFRSGIEVELNDLSALGAADGKAFSVGPLINVYNEATLGFLVHRGAKAFCLPPELPFASIEILSHAAVTLNAGVEVWAYGRAPLAISARCYHARIHGFSKDSCRFVCATDPDGLPVRTVDGRDFLAINGVQTLSHVHVNLIGDIEKLAAAGVASLRLSPHSGDFIALTKLFRAAIDGEISGREALARSQDLAPQAAFSHGFAFGAFGAELLAVG
jgi:collagenase-like PrtC family protease